MLLTDFIALREALSIFELGLLFVHLLELECFDFLPEPVIPLEEGELAALGGLFVQAVRVQRQYLLVSLVGQLE